MGRFRDAAPSREPPEPPTLPPDSPCFRFLRTFKKEQRSQVLESLSLFGLNALLMSYALEELAAFDELEAVTENACRTVVKLLDRVIVHRPKNQRQRLRHGGVSPKRAALSRSGPTRQPRNDVLRSWPFVDTNGTMTDVLSGGNETATKLKPTPRQRPHIEVELPPAGQQLDERRQVEERRQGAGRATERWPAPAAVQETRDGTHPRVGGERNREAPDQAVQAREMLRPLERTLGAFSDHRGRVSRFELCEALGDLGLTSSSEALAMVLPPTLVPLRRGAFGLEADHANHGHLAWLTERQFREVVNRVLVSRHHTPLPLPRQPQHHGHQEQQQPQQRRQEEEEEEEEEEDWVDEEASWEGAEEENLGEDDFTKEEGPVEGGFFVAEDGGIYGSSHGCGGDGVDGGGRGTTHPPGSTGEQPRSQVHLAATGSGGVPNSGVPNSGAGSGGVFSRVGGATGHRRQGHAGGFTWCPLNQDGDELDDHGGGGGGGGVPPPAPSASRRADGRGRTARRGSGPRHATTTQPGGRGSGSGGSGAGGGQVPSAGCAKGTAAAARRRHVGSTSSRGMRQQPPTSINNPPWKVWGSGESSMVGPGGSTVPQKAFPTPPRPSNKGSAYRAVESKIKDQVAASKAAHRHATAAKAARRGEPRDAHANAPGSAPRGGTAAGRVAGGGEAPAAPPTTAGGAMGVRWGDAVGASSPPAGCAGEGAGVARPSPGETPPRRDAPPPPPPPRRASAADAAPSHAAEHPPGVPPPPPPGRGRSDGAEETQRGGGDGGGARPKHSGWVGDFGNLRAGAVPPDDGSAAEQGACDDHRHGQAAGTVPGRNRHVGGPGGLEMEAENRGGHPNSPMLFGFGGCRDPAHGESPGHQGAPLPGSARPAYPAGPPCTFEDGGYGSGDGSGEYSGDGSFVSDYVTSGDSAEEYQDGPNVARRFLDDNAPHARHPSTSASSSPAAQAMAEVTAGSGGGRGSPSGSGDEGPNSREGRCEPTPVPITARSEPLTPSPDGPSSRPPPAVTAAADHGPLSTMNLRAAMDDARAAATHANIQVAETRRVATSATEQETP